MRANRATTAPMPSPTFTNSTTCTVPRSSPLLSSSFTPFYPRSQQQIYHPQFGYGGSHDGGCHTVVHRSDDVDASQGHISSWSHGRSSNIYDPQYYASLGGEPYEGSWVPTAVTVWDGGAWQQWGDPAQYAYAEDDTGDSANFFSDSLSYYTESPTLEQDIACVSSNPTSVPMLLATKDTQLFNCRVNEGSEYLKTSGSFTSSTTMPDLFHSTIIPEHASCASKKLKESSLSSLRDLKETAVLGYGQGAAKGERKEAAYEFQGSMLDLNCPRSQVPEQMSSDFGSQAHELAAELKLTTDLVGDENLLLKASYSLSKEHGSADITGTQCSIPVTSNTIEHISNPNLSSASLSPATNINSKEAQNMKCASLHDNSFQSSNVFCQNMVKPVSFQAPDQVNDLEGMHQERPKSSRIQPEDIRLCSNGPQLLVECIHNLSKVLLSSQSKTSSNALNPSDCLVLENTISMLSYRLFQCFAIESNSCPGLNCQQQEQKSSNDSIKVFPKPGIVQNASNQFATTRHIFSFKKFGLEDLQDAAQLTAASSVGKDDQSLDSVNHLQVSKEELRLLKDELQKLRSELEYERAESNAAVSVYKDLWSEAQEALNFSMSEIRKIRTELDGLKQDLTNLKISGAVTIESKISSGDCRATFEEEGISKFATILSQGVLASNLSRTSNNICLSKDAQGLASYFDSGNLSNSKKTEASFTECENVDSITNELETSAKHSSKSCETIASKSSKNCTIAPPMNLENDVARRLSLLLSRQGLDLNKTCFESCMEPSAGSSTIFESSFNIPEEDEAMPLNNDYLVWSETSYLVNDDNGSGYLVSNFGCQKKQVPAREEDRLYGLTQSEPNDGGMISAELMEGLCQEDENEIICFKPGIGESKSTSSKGESDWEDVIVNALEDRIWTDRKS